LQLLPQPGKGASAAPLAPLAKCAAAFSSSPGGRGSPLKVAGPATPTHARIRRFTAEEVIGYIRVVRPGSVIGPQQNYIREIQPLMWSEGDAWRAARGGAAAPPPPPAWGPAAAPSRAGSLRRAAVDALLLQAGAAGPGRGQHAPQLQRMGSSGKARPAAAAGALQQPSGGYALVVDGAAGSAAGLQAAAPQMAPHMCAPAAAAAMLSPPLAGSCVPLASSTPGAVPGAPALVKAHTDLSLMQYAQEQRMHQPRPLAQPPGATAHAPAPVARPRASASSMAAAAAAYLGPGSVHAYAALSYSHAHAPSLARPAPPLQPLQPPPQPVGRAALAPATRASYSIGSSGGSYLHTPHAVGSSSPVRTGSLSSVGGGAARPHFTSLGSSSCGPAATHSLLSASLLLTRPASQQAPQGGAGGRSPSVPRTPPLPASGGGAVGAAGRAPSAPRERAASGTLAGLRAALHVDMVQASAGRPRYADVESSCQSSSDFYTAAWRQAAPAAAAFAGAPARAVAAAGATRPASRVVRVLAPNGQPRKVPVAALLQAPQTGGAAAGAGPPGRLPQARTRRSNSFGSPLA
jgi:cell division cycle 14